MIHLVLKREPHWLDLGHGVRVHVRPCTTALMMAARHAIAEGGDPAARSARLVAALAGLAVMDWEGVGDELGDPMPISTEGIAALFDLWPMAEAFERLYLGPALLLDAEKNA